MTETTVTTYEYDELGRIKTQTVTTTYEGKTK